MQKQMVFTTWRSRHVSDLFLDPRNQSNPDFLLTAKCSFLMTNFSTHILEGSMYLFRDPALSLLMFPLSSASPALLFISTIYKHISLLFKKKKRYVSISRFYYFSDYLSESNFSTHFPLFPMKPKMNCDPTSIMKLIVHDHC